MRSVAREMNLSETAFVVPNPGFPVVPNAGRIPASKQESPVVPDAGRIPASKQEAPTVSDAGPILASSSHARAPSPSFSLRWLTPTKEVELCGHATLASAHALWEMGRLPRSAPALFETRSGRLICTSQPDGSIAMDFPANPATALPASEVPPALWDALGMAPCPVQRNRLDYMLILTDAKTLRAASPDFARLATFSAWHGFVLTAPSDDPAYDYLCRYFVPAFGVNEDPVTGSIQTMLGPFWAKRLGKDEVRVWQASARGGGMRVRPVGDRVVLLGNAVTTVRGDVATEAMPDPNADVTAVAGRAATEAAAAAARPMVGAAIQSK